MATTREDLEARVAAAGLELEDPESLRLRARLIDEVATLMLERRRAARKPGARPTEEQKCQPTAKEPGSASTGSPTEDSGESSRFSQMVDERLASLEMKPTPISTSRRGRSASNG